MNFKRFFETFAVTYSLRNAELAIILSLACGRRCPCSSEITSTRGCPDCTSNTLGCYRVAFVVETLRKRAYSNI